MNGHLVGGADRAVVIRHHQREHMGARAKGHHRGDRVIRIDRARPGVRNNRAVAVGGAAAVKRHIHHAGPGLAGQFNIRDVDVLIRARIGNRRRVHRNDHRVRSADRTVVVRHHQREHMGARAEQHHGIHRVRRLRNAGPVVCGNGPVAVGGGAAVKRHIHRGRAKGKAETLVGTRVRHRRDAHPDDHLVGLADRAVIVGDHECEDILTRAKGHHRRCRVLRIGRAAPRIGGDRAVAVGGTATVQRHIHRGRAKGQVDLPVRARIGHRRRVDRDDHRVGQAGRAQVVRDNEGEDMHARPDGHRRVGDVLRIRITHPGIGDNGAVAVRGAAAVQRHVHREGAGGQVEILIETGIGLGDRRKVDAYHDHVGIADRALIVRDHQGEGVAAGAEGDDRPHHVIRIRLAGPCVGHDGLRPVGGAARVKRHIDRGRTKRNGHLLVGAGLRRGRGVRANGGEIPLVILRQAAVRRGNRRDDADADGYQHQGEIALVALRGGFFAVVLPGNFCRVKRPRKQRVRGGEGGRARPGVIGDRPRHQGCPLAKGEGRRVDGAGINLRADDGGYGPVQGHARGAVRGVGDGHPGGRGAARHGKRRQGAAQHDRIQSELGLSKHATTPPSCSVRRTPRLAVRPKTPPVPFAVAMIPGNTLDAPGFLNGGNQTPSPFKKHFPHQASFTHNPSG